MHLACRTLRLIASDSNLKWLLETCILNELFFSIPISDRYFGWLYYVCWWCRLAGRMIHTGTMPINKWFQWTNRLATCAQSHHPPIWFTLMFSISTFFAVNRTHCRYSEAHLVSHSHCANPIVLRTWQSSPYCSFKRNMVYRNIRIYIDQEVNQ